LVNLGSSLKSTSDCG